MKPWESPYVTFGGNPIAFADPSGLDRDAKGNIVTKEVVCEAKRYEPTPEQAGREYTPQYHYEPYGKVFKFDGYDRTVLRTGNQGNSGKYGSSDELWTYINGQWTYSTIPGNNEAALKRLETASKLCDGMQLALPAIGIGIVGGAAIVSASGTAVGAYIGKGVVHAGLDLSAQLAFNGGDFTNINYSSIGASFAFNGTTSWYSLLGKSVAANGLEYNSGKGYRGFFGEANTSDVITKVAVGFALDKSLVSLQNLNSAVTPQRFTRMVSLSDRKPYAAQWLVNYYAKQAASDFYNSAAGQFKMNLFDNALTDD